MGRNICKAWSCLGVRIQNIWGIHIFHVTQCSNNKVTPLEIRQVTWRDVSQKKTWMANIYMKKVFNIINHKGNANQSHNGYHLLWRLVWKKDNSNKFWTDCEETEIPVLCLWEYKLVQ